jgi:hypothetical protein
MLAALSTANKIGLGLSGLAFVTFALVTSMLVPRRNPDFPGRRKPLYLVVCFLFFVGMMLAVIVFGKEEPEPEHGEAAPIAALYR